MSSRRVSLAGMAGNDDSDLPSHTISTHHKTTTNLFNKLALQFPSIRATYKSLFSVFSASALNPSERIYSKVSVPGASLPAIVAQLVPAAVTVPANTIFSEAMLSSESVSFGEFLIAVATNLYLPHPLPAPTFPALDSEAAAEAPAELSAAEAAYTQVRTTLVNIVRAFESIAQQRADGTYPASSPELQGRADPHKPTRLHDPTAQIDVAHFKAALFGTVTHSNTIELLEARFNELDLDNSGKIDFAEFACGLMKWTGIDEDDE